MKTLLKWIMPICTLTILACNPMKKNIDNSFDDFPIWKGEWFEMKYSPEQTHFQLWAPTAQEVRVLIYDDGVEGAPQKMLTMKPINDGCWEAYLHEDLKGKFYTFNVKINDVWQGDTPGLLAKAVGVNGHRAAIIELDKTNPEGWSKDVRPPLHGFNDMVIYELHYRDFSADSTSGIKNRGKYLALTEDSTHTWLGENTGIRHLKELGITHVQLMPSFDFASIDETKNDRPKYNWGYDPQNYWVPEGSYSTNPFLPDVRIREFKEMVMSLHKAGIRVIMDMVFNHTATFDKSNFQRIVPDYFYRLDANGKPTNASGCGNETASERPMMRRFMIETLQYWVNEYHIDGFRFDLMGIHDIETMNEIRRAMDKIDPTIYLGGEGWAAGKPHFDEKKLAMKRNMISLPRIAAFSDEFRDSLRGPFGHDEKGAFVIGKPNHEMGIKFGLVGGILHPQVNNSRIHRVPDIWAKEPNQFISYVSCHDDLCLVDRLKRTLPGASVQELKALAKLSMATVLVSQGIPFIFNGDELMRDKDGVANSYNVSDSVNAINWNLKSANHDVFDYVRGLIHLRRLHPCFRLGSADEISKKMDFLPVNSSNVIAFRIKGKPTGETWLNTIVIINTRTESVKVDIPDGKYWIAARDGQIDLVLGLGTLFGSVATVAPRSVMIIHQ